MKKTTMALLSLVAIMDFASCAKTVQCKRPTGTQAVDSVQTMVVFSDFETVKEKNKDKYIQENTKTFLIHGVELTVNPECK